MTPSQSQRSANVPTSRRRRSMHGPRTRTRSHLAVYEHGMSRIRDDQAAAREWIRVACRQRRGAHTWRRERGHPSLLRSRGLLRSVVRTSGIHPEVLRRGEEYSRQLGAQFVDRVLERREALVVADPETSAWHCFNVIFATCAMRISNGPTFAAQTIADDQFTAQLVELATAYLLGVTLCAS